MNILKFLTFILLTNFGLAVAAEDRALAYFSGNGYLKLDNPRQQFYIAGIVDTMRVYAVLNPDPNPVIVCTKEMTIDQVKAIVDKFMKQNPQEWHNGMAGIAIGAIFEACGLATE